MKGGATIRIAALPVIYPSRWRSATSNSLPFPPYNRALIKTNGLFFFHTVARDGDNHTFGIAVDVPLEANTLAGFVFSLVSNMLWFAWGWHVQAFALLGLQLALIPLNVRGVSQTGLEGR